jgi:hypothetical protein
VRRVLYGRCVYGACRAARVIFALCAGKDVDAVAGEADEGGVVPFAFGASAVGLSPAGRVGQGCERRPEERSACSSCATTRTAAGGPPPPALCRPPLDRMRTLCSPDIRTCEVDLYRYLGEPIGPALSSASPASSDEDRPPEPVTIDTRQIETTDESRLLATFNCVAP